ncbi:MAG: hypothetical protein DCC75_08085 [Proteobacteria bacterium]|nr:MAG: hypothetical protein DCC75_08085 [Pseudomonadota bacterium]
MRRLALQIVIIVIAQCVVLLQTACAQAAPYLDSFTVGDTSGLSGMILFSAQIDDLERILVLDLDGQRVRKAVDGPGNNSYPAWRPDGLKFAFSSDRDGNKEIYLADWDGGNQRRLTNNTVVDENPAWSPDKESIVYYSESGPPKKSANLFAINPDNLAIRQLTRLNDRNTTPDWSPDGENIVYSTNAYWPGWDICLWNFKAQKQTCILSGAQSYCRPRYSPAGRFIVYSQGLFDDVDIYLLDLQSNTKSSLTSLPGREYDIAWGPDFKGGPQSDEERYIVFSAENGKKEIFNLYIIGKDRKVKPLLESPYSLRFPSWSGSRTFDLEARRIREAQGGKLPK